MMTPEQIHEYIDERIDVRMEHIAEAAAEKAIQKIYADIGQGILRKAAWFVGVVIIALLSWLAGKGGVKLPSP